MSLFTTKKLKLKKNESETTSTDNIKRKQQDNEDKEITKRLKMNEKNSIDKCDDISQTSISKITDKQTEELDDLFSDNWDDELDKVDAVCIHFLIIYFRNFKYYINCFI